MFKVIKKKPKKPKVAKRAVSGSKISPARSNRTPPSPKKRRSVPEITRNQTEEEVTSSNLTNNYVTIGGYLREGPSHTQINVSEVSLCREVTVDQKSFY
jgi:hypothetical protein